MGKSRGIFTYKQVVNVPALRISSPYYVQPKPISIINKDFSTRFISFIILEQPSLVLNPNEVRNCMQEQMGFITDMLGNDNSGLNQPQSNNDANIHREDAVATVGEGKLAYINWISRQIPQRHALTSEISLECSLSSIDNFIVVNFPLPFQCNFLIFTIS